MIKRQVLTPVEVLSKPIEGRKLTHFVTGYGTQALSAGVCRSRA